MQRLEMYKTILVPLDGSARSARALPIDAALAELTAQGVTATALLLEGTIIEALIDHACAAGSTSPP
jgi:nucleotide-binding universal stress UspA family protein